MMRALLLAVAAVLAACGAETGPTPVPFKVWVAISGSAISEIQGATAAATRPTAAIPVVRLADDELAHMAGEVPEPCYATAHDLYRQWLAALRELMIDVRDSRPVVADKAAYDRLTGELTDEIYRAGDACS